MQRFLNKFRDLGIKLYMDGEELKASGPVEYIDDPELLKEICNHRDQLKVFAKKDREPKTYQAWINSIETHKCTDCRRFYNTASSCEIYSELAYPDKPVRCIWFNKKI